MERSVEIHATISKWRSMYQNLKMTVPPLVNDSRTDGELLSVYNFPRMWECLGVDNVRVQEVAAFEGRTVDPNGDLSPYIVLDDAIIGSDALWYGFQELGWTYESGLDLDIEPSGVAPNLLSVNRTFTIMFNVARNYYPANFTVSTGLSFGSLTNRMTVTPTSAIVTFTIPIAAVNDTHIRLTFSPLIGNDVEGNTSGNKLQILRFYTADTLYVNKDLVSFEIENKANLNVSLPISHGSITVQNVENNYSKVSKGDRVEVFATYKGVENPLTGIQKPVCELIGIYYVSEIDDKVFSLEQTFKLVDANEYLSKSVLKKDVFDSTRKNLRDQSYAASAYRTDKMMLLSPTDTTLSASDISGIGTLSGYTTDKINAKVQQDIENSDLMGFTAIMHSDKMIAFGHSHGRVKSEFGYKKPRAMSYSGFGVMDIPSITGVSHNIIDNALITKFEVKYVQPPAWVRVRKYPNNHASDYKDYTDVSTSMTNGEGEKMYDCEVMHTIGTDSVNTNLVNLHLLDYEISFDYFAYKEILNPYERIQITAVDKRTNLNVTFKGYVTSVQHTFKNGYNQSVTMKGVKV